MQNLDSNMKLKKARELAKNKKGRHAIAYSDIYRIANITRGNADTNN